MTISGFPIRRAHRLLTRGSDTSSRWSPTRSSRARPVQQALRLDADVAERLIKTRDGTTVHLFVGTVAAMHPQHGGLIAKPRRKRLRPPKRFGPVGREPLGVIGSKAVAEGVTDHLVCHHALMPCPSETTQTFLTTSSLVHGLHSGGS
jgi:hypothetical protein